MGGVSAAFLPRFSPRKVGKLRRYDSLSPRIDFAIIFGRLGAHARLLSNLKNGFTRNSKINHWEGAAAVCVWVGNSGAMARLKT